LEGRIIECGAGFLCEGVEKFKVLKTKHQGLQKLSEN
jgi:hypothetical protein